MKFRVILIFLLVLLSPSLFAEGVQVSSKANPSTLPSLNSKINALSQGNSSKSLSAIPIKKVQPFISKPQDSAKIAQPILKPASKVDSPLQIVASTDISTYQKISLPDAIDYAMEHNLDIIRTRLNINIAKNNIKVARRLKNPYVQFFFNEGKASTDNPNNVGLIFPIELFKRGPRKNLAKANLELTKGNVLLSELMLRLDVRQYYTDLVAAKSMLKILDEQRQLLQELLNVAQKKYEVGAVPQMDVIHAKMTLNQLLIQVNSAKTNVLVARYKFNFLLTSKNFDTKEDYLPEQNKFISMLTPNPTGKIPDFDTLFNIALDKRLDIKNARQEIEVARKNLVTIVRQRIPDIEIGGGPIFVPQAWSTAGRNTYGVYAGGNITNIPLFYMYNPEIKNAKIQMEQKELAFEEIRHQALMDLHSAYDSFITAQANLNYYTDVLLAESKQFLGMAKRSYQVGKSSITDLIFIEQSYKNIMMSYTTALKEYYNAWINILKEVNDEELKLNG